MNANDDNLTAARQRIQTAYDPDLFQNLGHRLADLLAQHLRTVEGSNSVVLNWADPRQLTEEALQTVASRGASTADSWAEPVDIPVLGERFSELVRLALLRGINLHDPRYVGHQVPAPVPIAGLFDGMAAVTNQPMAIYEMGPWGTAVEQAMFARLAEYIGWQGTDYGAVLTHGASLANLTALLVARNVVLGESWERGVPRSADAAPKLVVQGDAHYCIARSAGILGLGTDNVVKAPLDKRRKMDVARLEEIVSDLKSRGQPVVAVVACASATPIGAFDPLEEIADVCERHGVWLHVDAAHGGAALISAKHRHLVAGLERADSLTWDAHKMLFVPAACAFLFYKDKRHSYEAFRQNVPYLFDPSAPGLADFDSGLRTVECTKRSAAMGLWGVWSLFGPRLFADLVDVTFDLGRQFYDKLEAAPDFRPLHEPECNIVMFRHIPELLKNAPLERIGWFQLQLRRAVIESGQFYLVPAAHDGVASLRCTLINPLTTPAHLDALLETFEQGRRILTSQPAA